jgi:Ca-activated chloride channel family protein
MTIRVNVPLVSLNVEVADSSGRPVTHLRQEDFSVYEDGKPQTVQTFGAADSPYSLILMFDCSDSTKKEWPLLKDAVAQFSKYQRPGDRVMTAAFGSQIQVMRNWNSNRDSQILPGICGGTRFYDALKWTTDRLRGVGTRRGVVMLTDAVDGEIPKLPVITGNRRILRHVDFNVDRGFQRALRSIEESGITYYFVAVNTDRNPGIVISPDMEDAVLPDMLQMRLRMERMAEATGGSVVFPSRPEEVIPMYEQIARQLGSTYNLGYAPPNRTPDGKDHKIEVRVRNKDLKVRQSRQSYTAR